MRAVAWRNYVSSFCMLSVLQVSVKVLNKESPSSAFDQFISDLEILSNLKHSNLAVLKVIHLHVRLHNFSAWICLNLITITEKRKTVCKYWYIFNPGGVASASLFKRSKKLTEFICMIYWIRRTYCRLQHKNRTELITKPKYTNPSLCNLNKAIFKLPP